MEQNPIDVKALLLKLWAKKKVFLIVWVATAAVVYGLTYLFPVQWQAKTEFVVNYNTQEWRTTQEIAWNSNIETELAPSGSVYSMKLFPTIMESAAYLNRLKETPLTSADGRTVAQVLLRRDTVQKLPEQLEILREKIVYKENKKTNAASISVTAYDPAQAVEIATLAREQLADIIAADRRANRLRNLQTYERCRETNATAQLLYDIARIELEREEPVFAIACEAEEPFRPESPRRVRITLVALLLMTLGLTIWYWRKDIPEWL